MNKWYRHTITKIVLVLLSLAACISIGLALVWEFYYPDVVSGILNGSDAEDFIDSESFSNVLLTDALNINNYMQYDSELMQNDMDFDKTLINIIETGKEGDVTLADENTTALTMSVQDLSDIDSDTLYYSMGDYADNWDQDVFICIDTKNTWHYFTRRQLENILAGGNLEFIQTSDYNLVLDELMYNPDLKEYLHTVEATGETDADYDQKANSTVLTGSCAIEDATGNIIYTDCNFFGYISFLDQLPADVDFLGYASDTTQYNTDLCYLCDLFTSAAWATQNYCQEYYEIVYQVRDTYLEGNTNLTYLCIDTAKQTVTSNNETFTDYKNYEEYIDQLTSDQYKYVAVYDRLANFQTNLENINVESWFGMLSNEDKILVLAVDKDLPLQDNYYQNKEAYDSYYSPIQACTIFGIASCLILLITTVWLTIISGRRFQDEEVHLTRFEKIPSDAAALLVFFGWLIPFFLVANQVWCLDEAHLQFNFVFFCLVCLYTWIMFMIGLGSLARRIKAHTLLGHSLIVWILKFIWKLLRGVIRFTSTVFSHLGLLWQILILFLGFLILHWIVCAGCYHPVAILLMIAAECAACVYLVYRVLSQNRISKGVIAIRDGQLDTKISTEKMVPSMKQLAENINSIGDGLQKAVDANMKNERLKTDLITNVSHDIKTPLTSIINYVDLLQKSDIDDPEIRHYLDVLAEKSQRLKVLTEDVVEASKVSSGNISLNMMKLNMNELILQTSGEFEEKFKARNLQEVMTLPDHAVIITSDGRRLYRVLENIYNNVAKYAMPGTRVYADLKDTDTFVTFSLKNISEHSLNISADELTERFIRGDVSRSTEGSGLGLSIAKSLTKLLGGQFVIYLDGDLFKVTITFSKENS